MRVWLRRATRPILQMRGRSSLFHGISNIQNDNFKS